MEDDSAVVPPGFLSRMNDELVALVRFSAVLCGRAPQHCIIHVSYLLFLT